MRPSSARGQRGGFRRALAARAPSSRKWFELCPQRWAAEQLRAGCGGTLTIEVHQVGRDRLGTQLAKQRGHLAAMVGTVIYQVLHRFPQRVAVDAEFQRLIF